MKKKPWPRRTTLSVSIKPEVIEKAKQIAKKEGLTVSRLVEKVIEQTKLGIQEKIVRCPKCEMRLGKVRFDLDQINELCKRHPSALLGILTPGPFLCPNCKINVEV